MFKKIFRKNESFEFEELGNPAEFVREKKRKREIEKVVLCKISFDSLKRFKKGV